ncbi:hypothetical protein H8356DRAFT_1313931 [Neocallimastix lanati (nom. inval.)]|uniref:Uncharacterized protein n=1 Tax=Neocallimastix californiae TaxID=1754190 RepID=A0A1Y2AE99_9FUNG|nr:hypothetical protein H8356DRAFT_1313931 [Neocallimastix sp. JGI-2020a]ORY20265.1 hypothetical protein LY90DRAFT_676861 [Neocallimastix californiae]|eukprot:ORY20265.1 hypothetical protein LY90DRAFT_676861 [Neocallimastix californiae]
MELDNDNDIRNENNEYNHSDNEYLYDSDTSTEIFESDDNNNENIKYFIEEKTEKISDSKCDDIFKSIFGNYKHENITKQFLRDIIDIEIGDSDKLIFKNAELKNENQYIKKEKRPIVDINIEINKKKTKKVRKKILNNKNDNNDNNKENSNNNNPYIEKEENVTYKEKIIVEMQVYRDKNFLNRCLYNATTAFHNLYKRGDQYTDNERVYSVNILYNNIFKQNKFNRNGKNNKENNSENIKNSESFVNNEKNKSDDTNNFFNCIQFMSSTNKEIVIPGIKMYFIELKKFNINNFDEKNNKNLWAAFFKIIDYKYEYNKINKKWEASIEYNLTPELENKFIKIPEIKEAIEICKEENMDEENYARFVNLIENDYELLYLREVKKNNDATIKKLEEDEKQNKATIKKLEEDVKKKNEDEKQNKATIKKLEEDEKQNKATIKNLEEDVKKMNEELKKLRQMIKDNRESNENELNENEINKKQKLND